LFSLVSSCFLLFLLHSCLLSCVGFCFTHWADVHLGFSLCTTSRKKKKKTLSLAGHFHSATIPC
jgi:hypothetical protein